ncbi:MAG: zinc ribbon domain-containing protein [bacterium]
MSDPLIARRCPWCGVAIREQAFFCPQCGKDLTQQPDFGATIAESAPPEIKRRDTAELVEQPTLEELPAKAPPAKTAAPKESSAQAAPAMSRKAPIGQQALGKMGAGIQKATHVARDVEGNVARRVQKLRDVSSVVIDEASYDASLRFVLVAVALFILFLVMLLLSKVIT